MTETDMNHIIRGKCTNFEDIHSCSGKGGYLHDDRRGLACGSSSHVLITLIFALTEESPYRLPI